ncbi:MAG: FAD:protein FMN transferase [Acidobacteria bacterium]|nr:FAD:protein FMN transferase [Acidobacteriota bacterium]
MKPLAALFVAAATVAGSADDRGLELVTRDAYLMGTRAHLAVFAPTRQAGLATLATALDVLDATEQELSTWRATSDVSALNRQPIGEPWRASAMLCRTFEEVRRWQTETEGAFDPAIGRLLSAWDVHGRGVHPTPEETSRAVAVSGLRLLAFDPTTCTLTRRADVALDAGAFGKGDALDRVEAALGSGPWLIDLGGQVSVGGPQPRGGWAVDVAHPRHRHRSYRQVRLTEGSLSTSGGSERDVTVGGVRISHIFDPRTGQPAAFDGSVTVWHRRALAADALSTALFVMGPDEGLPWAESHGIAALYLVPSTNGMVRATASAAFRELFGETKS